MIMTEEQAILKAKEQFDEMIGMIQQAATGGRMINEVEGDIWKRLLQIGRLSLQGYVDLQGTGDLGATLEYKGQMLKRLEELYDRRYVSVFGEIAILRTAYGTRPTQKQQLVPLDARLALPEGDFSYLLQQWDQSLCVKSSYDQSRETIERILGIGQSVGSLEQMNRSMAEDVESFRHAQPTPAPEDEGRLVVLTADGKGVPMRRDAEKDAPAVHGRRKKGQKAHKKRQACVGAVYTTEPFPRTAQDVVDEVMRKRKKQQRPSPQNKRLRAELTRTIEGQQVNGKELIFRWFSEQLQARNGDGKKKVVCVMDGERALWKMLAKHVTGIICIIDVYHVLQRIWDAAHCFWPEGSQEARDFVTERLERILEGKVGRVIGGLKQMGTKHKLRKSRRRQLSEAVGYLHRNRHLMRYDDYLAKGYPIGSGVVEGACRHLVKDRMELTGMRWRTVGAQAMLDLRSVFLNGDWDAFQQYRIKTNCRKLYPYRGIIESKKWSKAA